MLKRKVIQYTMDMEPVARFNSIKEAQDAYKLTHISGVCRGKRKSEGGYIWRYEEDEWVTDVRSVHKYDY